MMEIIAAAGWATALVLSIMVYKYYVTSQKYMMIIGGLIEDKIKVIMASSVEEIELEDE